LSGVLQLDGALASLLPFAKGHVIALLTAHLAGKYAGGTSGGAIAAGPFGGGGFPDLVVNPVEKL
jgi:hypothetical protein